MNHYFTDNPHLEENRKEISFRFWCFNYSFLTDNGVFAKDGIDYGTKTFLDAICTSEELQDEVLDVGCGYGVIGITLKKIFPEKKVTMIDVNHRALKLSEDNAKKNNVEVEILESDAYSNLQQRVFTDIITNPPIRAGKQVIYKIFEEAYDHLKTEGQLWVVIRKQHGALSAKKKIEEIFGNCSIIKKDKGFFILKAKKH